MADKAILQANTIEIRKEAIAGEIMSPGNFVTLTSDGTIDLGGATGPNYMVVEDRGQGKAYADVYAAGDLVSYDVLKTGDRVLAKCTGALAFGDLVEVNTDGVGEVLGTGVAKFICLEANASGAANLELEVI